MTRVLVIFAVGLPLFGVGCDDAQEAPPPSERAAGLLEGAPELGGPGVVAPEPAPEEEPKSPADLTAGRWEVAVGPSGAPLPAEVRRARALASLEARRAERRRLFDLGGARTQAADESLVATALADGPASARVNALRALAGEKRPAFVSALRPLLEDGVPFEIRVEAAVTLTLWGEVALTMPFLKELGRLGAQLRRAFVVLRDDGSLGLRPEARDYFRTALSSPEPRVRVDAAIGLLEFGEAE